eukprot:SAG11_NODE_7156_length_1185_cov_2.546041_2_plen_136_part_00
MCWSPLGIIGSAYEFKIRGGEEQLEEAGREHFRFRVCDEGLWPLGAVAGAAGAPSPATTDGAEGEPELVGSAMTAAEQFVQQDPTELSRRLESFGKRLLPRMQQWADGYDVGTVVRSVRDGYTRGGRGGQWSQRF